MEHQRRFLPLLLRGKDDVDGLETMSTCLKPAARRWARLFSLRCLLLAARLLSARLARGSSCQYSLMKGNLGYVGSRRGEGGGVEVFVCEAFEWLEFLVLADEGCLFRNPRRYVYSWIHG